jgi:hypothetical protein
MTVLTVLVAICAALIALQLVLSVRDRLRPRGMLAERVRRTLIVHRVGLPSIRGVLVEEQPEGSCCAAPSTSSSPSTAAKTPRSR